MYDDFVLLFENVIVSTFGDIFYNVLIIVLPYAIGLMAFVLAWKFLQRKVGSTGSLTEISTPALTLSQKVNNKWGSPVYYAKSYYDKPTKRKYVKSGKYTKSAKYNKRVNSKKFMDSYFGEGFY